MLRDVSRTAVVILIAIGWLPSLCAASDDGKAGFAVKVREDVCPYRVLGVYARPGEDIPIEVLAPGSDERFVLDPAGGPVNGDRPGAWTWTAPADPGLHTVVVRREDGRDEIRLNVFVLVPFDRIGDGQLQGYRIGTYPAVALRNLAIYERPAGFVRVTAENADTLIAPHHTLRQFLCKQDGGYPKFVVLTERLLLRLERLLKVVNEAGISSDGWFVMSGYRTPFYNEAIGNVTYSRHLWGDAADIFVDDDPKDGIMDDLNRDGKIDIHDAGFLQKLIEEAGDGDPPLPGGLGRYGSTPSHGPFVHVDVRGYRARW